MHWRLPQIFELLEVHAVHGPPTQMVHHHRLEEEQRRTSRVSGSAKRGLIGWKEMPPRAGRGAQDAP